MKDEEGEGILPILRSKAVRAVFMVPLFFPAK
jgi:hypothetical protein